MKPILKWAGGKRWLIPLLKEIWNTHQERTLVEPFTGGLAISLGLNPTHARLNDVNEHLINFYQQVRKGLKINGPLKNEADFYYAMRDQFNQLIRDKRTRSKGSAKLFYYLIKTGYNGLCRFNSSGEFNVPFGQHKQIHYKVDFLEYQTIFQDWEFTSGDFEGLPLVGTEFLYVDPPYDVEFTKYYANGFQWQDQLRLIDWLALHQGPIIASNQATERILKLYKQYGFTLFVLPARRSISCTGDRKPALEMLAFKGLDKESLKIVKKALKRQTA